MPDAARPIHSCVWQMLLFVLLPQLPSEKAKFNKFFFSLFEILLGVMLEVFRNAEASSAFLQQQIDSCRPLDFLVHNHPQGGKIRIEDCLEAAAMQRARMRRPGCKTGVFISDPFYQTCEQVLFQALAEKELMRETTS